MATSMARTRMITLEEAHSVDAAYYGDRPEWLIAYRITRDAAILDLANWEAMQTRLGDAPEWTIERSGHWLVGWIDSLVVKPDSDAHRLAEAMLEELADYPVLDDELFSDMETDATEKLWERMSLRERVDALKERGESIFAARCNAQALWDRAPLTYEHVETLATE